MSELPGTDTLYQLWELDVGGSNPSTPTKEFGREKGGAGTDAGTFSHPNAPVAAHVAALHELGAATAEVEREHPGVDLLGAFLAGYEAQRARLRARAVQQGRDDLGSTDIVGGDERRSAPLTDPTRCDCGAALAHVHSESYSAVLCPECDADALGAR